MKKRLLIVVLCFFLGINARIFAKNEPVPVNSKPATAQNETPINSVWNTYLNSVETELTSNWFPPKYRNDVEVIFKINKEGQFQKLKIVSPSQDLEDNQAAIDAVLFASPFKPLPGNTNEIMIKYVFPAETGQKIGSKNNIQAVIVN